MKRNILLILVALSYLTFGQEYRHFYKPLPNGVILDSKVYQHSNAANSIIGIDNFPSKGEQTADGLSSYFVTAKLDTGTFGFVYETPVDIYKDSLLIRRINNISSVDSPLTDYYTRDNVYRAGAEPAIIDYSYNGDRNLSKVLSYSFDDNGIKYLKEKDVYTYSQGRLDSVLIFSTYNGVQNSYYQRNNYQYKQDTVIVINYTVYPTETIPTFKTESVYSNGQIMSEEAFSDNYGSSMWLKYFNSDYYYNADNTLNRREDKYFDQNGNVTMVNQIKYAYNADKTVKQIIFSGSIFYYVISYAYSTNNFVSILTPKDKQTFAWSDNEIKFNFYSYDSTNVNLLVSTNNGGSWQSIANNLPTSQVYTWNILHSTQQDYLFKAVDVNSPNSSDIAYVNIYERALITQANHNTGSLQFQVDNRGSFSSSYPGFSFNKYSNVLYAGGFAASSKSVPFKGSFYFAPISYDFKNSENMYALSSNSYFDQISNCAFVENNQDIGISVGQETLSDSGDSFVLIRYRIKNISNNEIDSLVVGDFMDLDIPDYASNLGGVNSTQGYVYQNSSLGSQDPNYYGMVAMQKIDGANVTNYYDTNNVRESFHKNFITIGQKTLTVPLDYRSFISSGPYTLEPNKEIEVGFAVIAGKDYSDFLNNIILAKQKYNSEVVGIKQQHAAPFSFSLSQNYPNPFNPSTTIDYSLSKESFVTISVYDILGRKIATLVYERKPAGNYSINFNASKLSSGIYFYQMKAGNYTQTKKMIVLK